MRQGVIAALATVALATGLVACGGGDASDSGTSSPADAVTSYFGAVKDGDADRICQLLTSDSVDAVVASGTDGSDCAAVAGEQDFGNFPADLKVGDATEDGDTATVAVTGDGQSASVPLKMEDGEWKIDLAGIAASQSAGGTSTTAPTTP